MSSSPRLSTSNKFEYRLMVNRLFSVLFITAVLILYSSPLLAAESDLSRAYKTDEKIEVGSLVSLSKTKEGYVVATNGDTKEELLGVAVNVKQSLLAVSDSPEKQTDEIQVAVSGQATTIVSDLNGEIKPGDLIAATPFAGVGAKAKPGNRVVGVAQKAFSASDAKKTTTVKDNGGTERELAIGTIPVVIAVGSMPGSEDGEGALGGVKQWLSEIAGKNISTARVVVTGIIAIIALSSIIVMVYSTIRNGVIATSRNPLAKPAIFEAMAQTMSMVALVAVISLATMYAVLRI